MIGLGVYIFRSIAGAASVITGLIRTTEDGIYRVTEDGDYRELDS